MIWLTRIAVNRKIMPDLSLGLQTLRLDHIILAVLITGGYGAEQTAEIYHPDRDAPCVIRNIPDERWSHTQDGSLVCGGFAERFSCRRWNPDTRAWDLVTDSLTGLRYEHTSWTPAPGSVTYLMGAGLMILPSQWIIFSSESLDRFL